MKCLSLRKTILSLNLRSLYLLLYAALHAGFLFLEQSEIHEAVELFLTVSGFGHVAAVGLPADRGDEGIHLHSSIKDWLTFLAFFPGLTLTVLLTKIAMCSSLRVGFSDLYVLNVRTRQEQGQPQAMS